MDTSNLTYMWSPHRNVCFLSSAVCMPYELWQFVSICRVWIEHEHLNWTFRRIDQYYGNIAELRALTLGSSSKDAYGASGLSNAWKNVWGRVSEWLPIPPSRSKRPLSGWQTESLPGRCTAAESTSYFLRTGSERRDANEWGVLCNMSRNRGLSDV